jgi:hypothetical protein
MQSSIKREGFILVKYPELREYILESGEAK